MLLPNQRKLRDQKKRAVSINTTTQKRKASPQVASARAEMLKECEGVVIYKIYTCNIAIQQAK